MKRILIGLALMLGIGSAYATDGVKANLSAKREVRRVKLLINNDRTAVLKGPVRTENIEALMNQVKGFAETGSENIFLIINSPGGSVVDGFELVNLIKSIKKEKGINTYCAVESEAYSMAAIIATFCHRTYMHKYSAIMFHEASYGVRDTATHIKNRVDFMDRYLKNTNIEISGQLGITPEKYAELIESEWWMTAEEAAANGIVDGVLDELYYTAKAPEINPFTILFGAEQDKEHVVVNPLRFKEDKNGNTKNN